ncbi:MAG: hypothetical protein ACRC1T_11940, partial [Clostridium chrysemydis]|uniref:hypothetical protein n=1 Tax=Clostridium chrysemydis TaxID=2665504 RepID=UPI003F3719C5
MNFKKRATKSITLALVGVSVVLPSFSIIDAMQINEKNRSASIFQSTNIDAEKTLEAVAQKYGFTQKETLLRESTPSIVVNSKEELENILSNLSNFIDELNSKNQVFEIDDKSTRATKQAKFSKGLGLTIGNWS